MAFCEPCKSITCENVPDGETFSLQSGLVFSSGVLVGTVTSCPVGFTCLPGVIPFIVVYDDDNWTIPVQPRLPIDGGQLILHGCSSDIVRIVPPNTSAAALQAIITGMFQEMANQQALCDATDGDEPGITPNPPPPGGGGGGGSGVLTLSSFNPTTACLSATFSGSIFASESASFSVIGDLPPGLVLAPLATLTTEATLTGTPTTAGTYVFVIKAEFEHTTLGHQEAVQQVTFSVVGITTASPLPNATDGAVYSQTIASTGMSGTLVWGVLTGSLPPGLSLNTATGAITGTVTVGSVGVYSFVVTVIN